ncbi:unnamed protein product [Cyprideis torosa]|uniref:GATOR2 complex protein MIO zinc-ribbon like domain-containing protein n=1 Tax=Cyprideis torosa TaxID=163714 RepID=A0A7R8W9P6_9CRUS|nr:unnamed protein product [Cyprideis torosa]CAG0885536.1 unnamed protein product [Cyprideis torosa]
MFVKKILFGKSVIQKWKSRDLLLLERDERSTFLRDTGNEEFGFGYRHRPGGGIDLLQKYVDVTGDVQTAALLAAHGCLVDDVSPRRWIMAYTDLLDAWGLWHQRALLDAMVVKGGGDNRAPPPQVFISCYFCGQSISPAISHQPRGGPVPGALSASPGKGGGRSSPAAAGATGILSPSMQPHSKGKTNSCRWCRKPLPRCSICLVHMGGGILDNDDSIGSWFCWCQTCRHGGHAAHLMVWFSKHSRCPVSGCPCRCLMLDENASFASDAEVSEEEEDA